MGFAHTIDYNDNSWEDGGFGEEMQETHERDPQTSKKMQRLDYKMHP
jgi:hypothetical protein